ncbi:hypothetical protein P4E94_01995 [Pontiellaceae bacterium B12219]|nr:hypothetical protein [Pontiellaceae bacterium B12219]
MANKVPDTVAREVKDLVFAEADKVDYLARSRVDNGKFLDQLVQIEQVGGRLAQFMRKAEVRTYIKDAILNRYSKDKTQKERPDDFRSIIEKKVGISADFVERNERSQVSLFKSPENNCFVVVADGTVLKWETALRKALLYIASKPFSSQEHMEIHILLALFARHQKMTPSDAAQLDKALEICQASAVIYGEG